MYPYFKNRFISYMYRSWGTKKIESCLEKGCMQFPCIYVAKPAVNCQTQTCNVNILYFKGSPA